MHMLQLQNVKRETNNKIPIEMLQKTNDNTTILGNNNNYNSNNHTKSNEDEPSQSNEISIQPNIDVDIVNTSTNIDNLAVL
jgi:hypothetical protein